MSESLELSGEGRFWPGFRQELLHCLRRWLALGTSGAFVGLVDKGVATTRFCGNGRAAGPGPYMAERINRRDFSGEPAPGWLTPP